MALGNWLCIRPPLHWHSVYSVEPDTVRLHAVLALLSRYLAVNEAASCRATLLMTFAHAIGAMTVLEQPVHLSSGGMQTHERFRAMCRLFTARGSI